MPFYQSAFLIKFMNPESTILSFIVKIHGIDRSGIEYIVKSFNDLRTMDMAKKHRLISCGHQSFSWNDRFKVCEEGSLP